MFCFTVTELSVCSCLFHILGQNIMMAGACSREETERRNYGKGPGKIQALNDIIPVSHICLLGPSLYLYHATVMLPDNASRD